MTPVEQAAATYNDGTSPRTFRQDLEAHLLHGMVYSTPTAFIMARYVRSEWDEGDLVDPRVNDTTGITDMIHIYLAAGDIKEFFTFPHVPSKWLSFERRGVVIRRPYSAIRSRIMKT